VIPPQFPNPIYSELSLSLSPATPEKVDPFTNTDHIYHVLEGPTPEEKQVKGQFPLVVVVVHK